MAIEPICARCGQALTAFGGILLSPPNAQDEVKKLHLCTACYKAVTESFDSNQLP